MQKTFIVSILLVVIVVAAVAGLLYFYQPAEEEPEPGLEPGPGPSVEVPALDDSEVTEQGIADVILANNRFSLDIYQQLKAEAEADENIFFSPYSISTALSMVYEGAKGETAEEIQGVFHFPEEASVRKPAMAAVFNLLNKKDKGYQLHTANALWVQQDYQLLKEYTDTVENYYGGKASNVDFVSALEQARQTINNWVEEKTNNKIKNLFEKGMLTSLTRLVLTNAVYFKGDWVLQFDKDKTKDEDFKVSAEKTIKAAMMERADEDAKFGYTETDDLQVLEMPYKGEELSMLVLLPKDDDLAGLEDSLTPEKLEEWQGSLTEQRVDVYFPKFTFTSKYTLNDILKAMGMPLAFSRDSADFSGMTGIKDLFIGIVVHQAFVEVNEEGTEAAAATGVGMMTTSMPVAVPVFRADHPFLFLIQDRETGNILFMGRVMNPTA